MDFELIENLSSEQVDELYNDVVDGEDNIALEKPWHCNFYKVTPYLGYEGIDTYLNRSWHLYEGYSLTRRYTNYDTNFYYHYIKEKIDLYIHEFVKFDNRFSSYITTEETNGDILYKNIGGEELKPPEGTIQSMLCYSMEECLEYLNNSVILRGNTCNLMPETYDYPYSYENYENYNSIPYIHCTNHSDSSRYCVSYFMQYYFIDNDYFHQHRECGKGEFTPFNIDWEQFNNGYIKITASASSNTYYVFILYNQDVYIIRNNSNDFIYINFSTGRFRNTTYSLYHNIYVNAYSVNMSDMYGYIYGELNCSR